MVRRCAVWFVKAGTSWLGGVCSGMVWHRLVWQVGLGADRCGSVGCVYARQVWHGLSRLGEVRLSKARQVWHGLSRFGEVRQVWHGSVGQGLD